MRLEVDLTKCPQGMFFFAFFFFFFFFFFASKEIIVYVIVFISICSRELMLSALPHRNELSGFYPLTEINFVVS